MLAPKRGSTTPRFTRRRVVVGRAVKPKVNSIAKESCALVINSSEEMAKEISFALGSKMPSCSILYAPTVQVARWILMRRPVDLVVSSPLLPDGSVSALVPLLESMEKSPDLVIVGSANDEFSLNLEDSSYSLTASSSTESVVKELGAELRDRLNNPLQEIVAMAFVAKAGDKMGPATEQALDAIQRAAHDMSAVVNKLEERIRAAVLES